MPEAKQQLIAAARRYNSRSRALEKAELERDEAIRQASAAGVSLRQIGRIVGLSHQRVDQIVRAARV